jgi:hypothetical protein
VDHIARWDGSEYHRVGSGINDVVAGGAIFDDGKGPSLHIAGQFTTAGDIDASGIARWNGSNWSPVGTGIQFSSATGPSGLAAFNDGSGPALFMVGSFLLIRAVFI